MWSCARSALLPSVVTAAPFTVTRPATINSSALRRLTTPACDRIFWRRSSAIARGPLVGGWLVCGAIGLHQLHPAELLELLERRQISQALQPELGQEFFGRLVQNGSADHVLAAALG